MARTPNAPAPVPMDRTAPRPQTRMAGHTHPSGFRAGQWVIHKNAVGIHVAGNAVTSEVHYVNDHGETTLVLRDVPSSELRTARLRDIPSSRRPKAHPGYES